MTNFKIRNFMFAIATTTAFTTTNAMAADTVVDIAVSSADHTTLVAAVKAAGLVDTLASEGKFTVFAPTNKAFGNLPEGTVDTLLKPENKSTLTKVLTAHVVSGRYCQVTER